MLYLGYVGFSVPFAFAIGGLITGRVGEGWLLDTRRWTLFAWGFLSVGIVLGAWWSYEVLGWGGVWGWDPVENASLLPWLTGTAFIHSVLVQERRGMLRVWNLSLLAATFCLTILGTFLTRSGVIESVHAFSDGPIGVYLLMFFALAAGTSIGLIGWRGDRLRSPGSIDSPLSREGAFLANNVLFALFAFVVLLGTVFPLVVEALQDRRLSVGRPVLRPDDHAARPGPAHADGDRPGPAVAQGLRRAPARPALLAGVPGRRLRRRAGAARRRRTGPAAGLRAGWVRGRLRVAPTRAGHPSPGLAGPGGPSQRRDGRARGRDHHRRGAGRADQLSALGRVPARRRARRPRSGATASRCWTRCGRTRRPRWC